MLRHLTVLMMLCMLFTLPAGAQLVKQGEKAVGKIAGTEAAKIGEAAGRKVTGKATTRVRQDNARVNVGRSASVNSSYSNMNVSAGKSVGSSVERASTQLTRKVTQNKAALQEQAKRAADEARKSSEAYARSLQKQLKLATAEKRREEFESGIGKSVLFIPNVALEKNPSILKDNPDAIKGYSMTIVKNLYNGKTEIFGIIPTHSLPNFNIDAESKFGVMRNFQAQVKLADGTEKLIPGEVVQISPQSMLDISLVKFNPKDEALLRPLEMADTPIQLGEPLFLYGEANGIPVSFEREITRNSFISARTNMIKAPDEQRQGFCGSPWLDMNGRLKAIHTGSVETENVSHGTHVSFVRKLIEAYHNGGKAEYDLMLDGHVLATLNVDEYISAFAILDKNYNIIYKEDGIGVGGWTPDGQEVKVFKKYSESRIRKAMNMPNAEHLLLHSRTPYWDTTDTMTAPVLIEDRSMATFEESQIREHIYDLNTHEIEWSTEAGDSRGLILREKLDGVPIK